MSYEQTMKSERQYNTKIKRTNERNESEREEKNRKEKYAQRIFKSVTTESFDFEILRTQIAFSSRSFSIVFIFILRIFSESLPTTRQSKSFVLGRIPL